MLVSHPSKRYVWGLCHSCACIVLSLKGVQVEHWKEQAGLSPEKRQMVDLLDVQDERWKNPDLEQQSVYSPKI